MIHKCLPSNPLEFIQKCMRTGNIFWTYHVNMRSNNRFISRQAVVESVDTYVIIEEYPDDKYHPSYLTYAEYNNVVLHILVAVDVQSDNVRVVTVYMPDLTHWESNYKTRRRK